MIAGIDYGSKLAGTTCICYNLNDKLNILQSEKKSDADALILDWVKQSKPKLVMLDAPLSLPLVYTDISGSDYHYRACDRELKAMSPMFLGGLTARAMKLRMQLSSFTILETYPKQVKFHRFAGIPGYKDNIEAYANQLGKTLPFEILTPITNWHQVDSVLAWVAGWHYRNGNGQSIGEEREGLIYY